MLVKVVYAVGRTLARLMFAVVLLAYFLPVAIQPPPLPASTLWWTIALVVAGIPAAVVVHEAGHLIACLVLRAEVRAVQFGKAESARLRFTVRGVGVSLGAPYNGRVLYAETPSAVRRAIIAAAGPLANLIAAVALLAVGRTGNGGVLGLALLMAGTGISNLLPYRGRDGRPTDGARLLALFGGRFAAVLRPRDANGWLPLAGIPATLDAEFKELVRHKARELSPEQTARWLKAYWDREPLALHAVGVIGRSLRLQGRIGELLALHADLPRPAGPSAGELTVVAHALDRQVLLVPGLPAKAVDLAVARVESVLRTAEFKLAGRPWSREVVLHTLALGRLRQGRFAEAEQLCQPILALPRPGRSTRATALATIALARRAAGLPYQPELTEARFLAPGADLVAEAIEPARAKAPDPGTTGDPQFQGA